jgi:16S rRNA G966 N2-methylase RsmD
MELDKLGLAEEERMFLGLLAGIASTQPRNKVSMFSGEQNGRKNKMKHIANHLHKIKHWKFVHGSYEDIVNETATWFIDPPYEFGGHAYVENKIDFTSLAEWCRGRQGQAIVCENTKANWLNFKPMSIMRGANGKHTTEAIWSNLPTNFDYQQQELF